MDVVLVPGLWLGAWSWAKVAREIEQAGHRPIAITLPGMSSTSEDSSAITLADHVAAVVAAIDAATSEQVVLVGHSAAAGIAYAALDTRCDRVARAVYVGGFPTADGEPLASGFDGDDDGVALPAWEDFNEADVRDLDEAMRAEFRERAVPAPAAVVSGVQRLADDRRFAVPVTVICPEFSAAQLQQWIDDGEPPVQEFTRLADVTYIDLPAGHWPQLTRPVELAQAILSQPPLTAAAR